MYNYAKLLGRIKEYGFTQERLAKAIGKSEYTISAKLNNRGFFSQEEMDGICQALDIPSNEIGTYFFSV